MADFLLLGAARCGTTSLFRYLQQHPQILPSRNKELHFFDLQFESGSAWYGKHFFPSTLRGERYIVGEATPYYLFHPLVPARVRAALPNVRLIVTLREPAERAVSHYAHNLYQGYETLPLAEALAREDERLAGEEARMLHNPTYHSFHHQHHSYKARGRYAQQLQRWLAFFPRTQLYVVVLEEWQAQPQIMLAQICRFLGLPEHQFDTRVCHNARERIHTPVAVAHELDAYFRESNRNLETLLGRPIGWNTNAQAETQ